MKAFVIVHRESICQCQRNTSVPVVIIENSNAAAFKVSYLGTQTMTSNSYGEYKYFVSVLTHDSESSM